MKLLHSKTGAAIARDVFGVDEEIYLAINWHTTGRAGMSLLEKIIYMADYIEPTRDFEGVEEFCIKEYEMPRFIIKIRKNSTIIPKYPRKQNKPRLQPL